MLFAVAELLVSKSQHSLWSRHPYSWV